MSLNVKLMKDLDLKGKRVLIREDLNVPVKDGAVASDARIRAALPTIQQAVAAGAKVILMSHMGRPTEGEFEAQYSMAPVAEHLAGLSRPAGYPAERFGRCDRPAALLFPRGSDRHRPAALPDLLPRILAERQ